MDTIFSEYTSLLEHLLKLQSQRSNLANGYISKKKIKGIQYYYLQNRVNGKIISKYIKEEDIERISEELDLSKKHKMEISQIESRLLKIEQAAKLLDKKLIRDLMLLKLSINMDNLSTEQKDKSISFANAMNAIEGVIVINATETKIADWKNGQKSFLTLFNETLTMYGFSTEVNNA